MYDETARSINEKVVSTFSVAAAILGLAPIFRDAHPRGLAIVPWFLAISAFLITAYLCHDAYSPREMRVGPDPRTIVGPDWLNMDPDQYQFYRLRDWGKTFATNRDVLYDRAGALQWAMRTLAVEVVAVVIALLTTS